MRPIANTIQRKLLLLLLLVGFVPAVVAVLHVHWGIIVGIDGILGRFLQERAEQTATAVDQSLADYFDAVADLQQAADRNTLNDRFTSPAMTLFDTVALVDSDGIPLEQWGSNPPERYQIPPSLRGPEVPLSTFLNEVADPRTGTSHLIFFAPVEIRPARFLVARVGTQRVVGAQSGALPASQSAGIFSNRGLFVAGTPVDGRILAAVRSHLAAAPVSGWLVPPNPGSRDLVGYSTPNLLRARRNDGLTSVDWLIIARMDMGEATALFSYLLWRSVLFGLFLTPVLVVLSYWLVRRLLRPVRDLHQQADRLAGGDLTARVKITTGDELEDLGKAFNDMAGSLDISKTALEEQMRMAESKARQISLVHNIAGAIISAFDLPRLFQTTHEQLTALLPHDGMTVVLFDPEGDGETLHHFGGGVFGTADGHEIRQFCELRLAESEVAHILDAGTGGGSLPPAGPPREGSPVASQFDQVCVLPLRAEPGLIGALVLGRTDDRRFSEGELRTLVQITQVLALAVEHIALYDRTRNFARDLERKVAERAELLERAQDKLIQAERFAATGRLAASIAHEINNPLGIIKNYLRILRDRLPELDSGSSEALIVVNEELDRIARIVRSLLYFYRPSSMRQIALDINEEIRVLLPLMEA